jgi:hypothetical protein
MSIRPPRACAKPREADPLTAVLENEILAEKAATYGRLIKQLESSLEALAALAETQKEEDRERLLDLAGEALWHVVIQRDLCGFRNHELFLRDIAVPPAVRLRMGPTRSQ